NVDSITVTHSTSTFVYGSGVIVQRSGTNHVSAHGMLIFPLSTFTVPVNTPNALSTRAVSRLARERQDVSSAETSDRTMPAPRRRPCRARPAASPLRAQPVTTGGTR